VLAIGEDNQKHLAAFTVDTLPDDSRATMLTAFLAERLPVHMLPAQFVHLDAMPLLPNGKIDRPALRALAEAQQANRRDQAVRPAHDHEQALINAWQRVLGRDDITPADSLVSLGGDSLNFVNLYLATENALGSVPSGWEIMSIAELCAKEPKTGRFWRWADTSMVTRAIAITIVVAEHLVLIPKSIFAGSTTALFLVTGYFFGALQLSTAFQNRRMLPLLRMMVNLLIPVMLFSIALYSWGKLRGESPNISMLLLTGNFYEYYPVNNGHAHYLWYVYAMVQIMAAILLATWLALRHAPDWMTAWRFSWILFAIGLVLRLGLPWLFVPGFAESGVSGRTVWVNLPTTYLSTIMLGILIALADSRSKRLLLVPVLLAYALTQVRFFPGWGGVYLMVFGLMLLFVRRVPLPPLVSWLVLPVSGASLYIYLAHFRFANILRRIGIEGPLLEVLFALLCGVLLWRAYSWLAAKVTLRLRHRASRGGKDSKAAAMKSTIG
jgi:acyl carrier protein